MYLALREMRFAKGRFALMGTVVALISFLLVMLSGLTAGLSNQSTSSIKLLPADEVVFGAPAGTDPKASFTESSVTPEQLQAWQDAPGVSSAEPLGITQGRIQAGGTASAAIFGVNPGAGTAPEGVSPGKAVVSQQFADDLGLKPGSEASVNGQPFTVASVVEDQWYSHTPVVWIPLSDWKDAAHTEPDVAGTVLAVDYDGGTRDSAAMDAANSAAGTTSLERSDSLTALPAYSSENGSLLMMQAFLYGISALVIVAFLTVWTLQRTRDIAVLRALGATRSYVLRDALVQAAVILAAGAAAGGLLGTAAGAVAATAAPFAATAATTVLPVAGVFLLGLAGAALAVRRVTKVDPLLALGGN